ncbi:GH25 family lysozyme [Streptomyces sp. NPDC002078]
MLGHYHFLWPGNIAAQAQWFVSHCDLKPGELLVCDWETTEANTYASNAEKDAFIAEVKKLAPGHRVGLYCNLDYWKRHDSTSDCGDFLWIADPDRSAGHPDVLHPWAVHQYGEANGTDLNVANFADRAAMKKWAGYPAPTPPPGPVPAPTPSVKDQVAAIEKTFATLTGQLTALKKSVGP